MERYDFYKDSGVEWIGEIPEHWEVKRLKQVAEINAETLSEKTPADYEFSYVDIGCVNSNGKIADVQQFTFAQAPSRARRIVKKDDIIVSTVRTYLRAIAYIDDKYKDAIVSTGFAVVSANKQVSYPKYLYYQITNEPFIQNIVSKSLGVSYPAINSEIFTALQIFLPDLAEQKAIVLYLDEHTQKLDRLIKNKKKQIARLKELRQIEINKAVTKGLNPDVELKDSGEIWIGDIPEHWSLKKLGSQFNDIGSGTTPEAGSPRYYENGSTPWLNTGDLNDGILISCQKSVTELALQDHSVLKIYPKGTLVIAMYGATIGKLGILDFAACTNQACCAINNSHTLSIKFAFYWLLGFRKEIINRAYGGGQPNISQDTIRRLKIAVPQKNEQEEIVTYLDNYTSAIDQTITNLEAQISQLQEVRKIEIFNAVTGKVKVPAHYFQQQEARQLV